jgi:hypothetical protein
VIEPVVLTPTRVHYVLSWEGRECASIEIVAVDGSQPEAVVTVTPDDDDVRVTFRVVPR